MKVKCPQVIDWLISSWAWALMVLMHLGLKNGPFVPHNLISVQESCVPLLKFQMAPRLRFLMSSGSKKKEPRYTYLSAAKASHSQTVRAKVSSSASHLLHKGLLVSTIKWRCLLRVLCPVRRPVTTLDCVLLKNKSMAFEARLGPKTNSWVCLWVVLRPHHLARFNRPQWNASSDFPLPSVHNVVSFPHQYKHL